MPIKDKEGFLKKYSVPEDRFTKADIKWQELDEIYDDYEKNLVELESVAGYISNSLMKANEVHSVRYRVKSPEHLIEKIIRKKSDDPNRDISRGTYREQITDLIGIRALHLFKNSWVYIDDFIKDKWDLKDSTIAYVRAGDPQLYTKIFEEKGCLIKEHPAGYRSVHYVIETKPAKTVFLTEIQVRTIFEEGWSEIDHNIRYPYETGNEIYSQFLSILNSLAGSADEMGTFIKTLQGEFSEKASKFNEEISKKNDQIKALEEQIGKLKIKPKEKEALTQTLHDLSTAYLNITPFRTSQALINISNIVEKARLLKDMREPRVSEMTPVSELLQKLKAEEK